MAGDINRVTLVGTPHSRSRAPPPTSGTAGPASWGSPSTGARRTTSGELDGQAEFLRREGLRQPGRDAGAASRQGPPGRHRRPPRLVVLGSPGRHEALEGRDRRRFQVQFLDSRGDGEGAQRQYVPACDVAADQSDFGAGAAPTTTSRSRRRTARWHSETRAAERAQAPVAVGRPIRRKSCYFCKEKIEEVDYKNYNQLRRYVSEKGKIRSRRITGACRRHQEQIAVAVKRAREMALLPYVSGSSDGRHPAPGRGARSACAATSSRSRAGTCGTTSLPRRLAEEATPARVAELGKRESQRARHEAGQSSRPRRSPRSSEGRAPLRGQRRAAGDALRLGHAHRHRRRDLANRKIRVDRRKIDLDEPIKRIGRYTIPIDVFQDVRVEVRRWSCPRAASFRPRRSSRRWWRPRAAEAADGRGRSRGRRCRAPRPTPRWRPRSEPRPKSAEPTETSRERPEARRRRTSPSAAAAARHEPPSRSPQHTPQRCGRAAEVLARSEKIVHSAVDARCDAVRLSWRTSVPYPAKRDISPVDRPSTVLYSPGRMARAGPLRHGRVDDSARPPQNLDPRSPSSAR